MERPREASPSIRGDRVDRVDPEEGLLVRVAARAVGAVLRVHPPEVADQFVLGATEQDAAVARLETRAHKIELRPRRLRALGRPHIHISLDDEVFRIVVVRRPARDLQIE